MALPAVLQDILYVGGMLGVTPLAQARLEERSGASAAVCSLWASAIGGIVGGVLSHPFDVVKTCMQGDLERRSFGTVPQALRKLLAEGGPSRLFHGVTWRTVNITATVWIANECCMRLPPYVRLIPRGSE